jgi:hypothetical protein
MIKQFCLKALTFSSLFVPGCIIRKGLFNVLYFKYIALLIVAGQRQTGSRIVLPGRPFFTSLYEEGVSKAK